MKNTSVFFFVAAASLSGVSAFAAASGAEISQSNLGNVMYVGDSITHGVNSASYRWALHKLFVDNGISYTGVGYKTGNYSNGVPAGTAYGGGVFDNAHSSEASARAWEISGRKTGTRFNGTNIENWLSLSGMTASGATYTGNTFDVDTFFLMIGTNDLLSDRGAITDAKKETTFSNLLGSDRASGDMGTIVAAMYKSNADASVTVLSLPCWTTHQNNNSADSHQTAADYNKNLKSWVANYNAANKTNVRYVDLNAGILDVASGTPFFGVSSMFNKPGADGLHPNAQGDLIIAGNIAKALGYAGRTAGQTRKAASEFSVNIENFAGTPSYKISTTNTTATADGKLDFSAEGESTLVLDWAADSTKSGFTVDFSLALGNGELDGWDTKTNFSMTLGDGTLAGTLNINEAYIQWGDTILYSTNMSANSDALRVSYVSGNAKEGLSAGFYVWLGDMLIGEALASTESSARNGVILSCDGTGTATLSSFSATDSGSFAPTTSGFVNADSAYIAITAPSKADPQGEITFPESGSYTKTAEDLEASGKYAAREQADSTAGGNGAVVGVTIVKGAATHIYASSGTYNGEVWATVKGGSASAWFGAHTNGDLSGNVGLRLTENCTGGATVFGAVNAGTVSGDVYLDISAENAVFNSFTGTDRASVVGAYNASIDGTAHIQISAGTFRSDVLGGLHHADGGQHIGKTEIYINGGNFDGSIYGGGLKGTIGSSARSADPATRVVITAGEISAAVYGGGRGDTINGAAAVEITGGNIYSDIYGGGSAGTINGNTSVTIEGSIASFANKSRKALICGGGSGGEIKGDSVVILKNILLGNNETGIDKFAGTISGGTNVSGTRSLILDNVIVSDFSAATLTEFDVVSLRNGTATALSSVGGASTLELQAGTRLDLARATDLSMLKTIVLGPNAELAMDLNLASASLVVVVDSVSSSFSLIALNSGDNMDLSGIKFRAGDVYYDAVAMIPDSQAGTVFITLGIPEPSAFGLLAGAGAIAFAASRRRRKK